MDHIQTFSYVYDGTRFIFVEDVTENGGIIGRENSFSKFNLNIINISPKYNDGHWVILNKNITQTQVTDEITIKQKRNRYVT